MNTDRIRRFAPALAVLAALPLLSACEHNLAGADKNVATFGEANRQTMMAQVVDPDPQYEYLDPATSAEHAGQAVERYRKGAVKQPDRVSSTTVSGGSGSSGGKSN